MTDRQITRQIGQNIRDARLKAGMTQECLAELVGVHWQTMSGIERGRYACLVPTFARIKQFLQISADSLLEGLSEPDTKRTQLVIKALARKRAPRKSVK